tara:strand:- start:47 stop:895 length:849 start_codon:yes stop_codon:yes gene_type:complete
MSEVDPLYDYHKNIKSPSEMGLSSKGTINQMGKNVIGLIDYVQILVTGSGKASKTGKPLGNKFFIPTQSKCKDIDNDYKDVSRHIYIDNVPTGKIPFMSSGMGQNFSSYKGLVPGAVENLQELNISNIFTSVLKSGGGAPDCKKVTLKVIGNDNKENKVSKYVSVDELGKVDRSNFIVKKDYDDVQSYLSDGFKNKTESLSNYEMPNMNKKITIKNNKNKDMNKPFNESLDNSAPFLEFKAIKKKKNINKYVIPDDLLVKVFFASFGFLGVVILFKLLKNRR